jgi:hypothetical protein
MKTFHELLLLTLKQSAAALPQQQHGRSHITAALAEKNSGMALHQL